jgi:hypothetical protein
MHSFSLLFPSYMCLILQSLIFATQPTKERAKKPRKTREARSAPQTSAPIPATPKVQPARTLPREPIVRDYGSIPRSTERPSTGPASTTSLPSTETDDETTPSRTGKVADRWAGMPLIGVKPTGSQKPVEPLAGLGRPTAPSATGSTKGDMIRRPLPGLARSPAPPSPKEATPPKRERSPSTPRARIPSTGSRPTVMDVAQTFTEEEKRAASPATPKISPPATLSSQPVSMPPVEASPPLADSSAPSEVASTGKSTAVTSSVLPKVEPVTPPAPPPVVKQVRIISPPSMERRMSSYTPSALPPLKEETTPVPSPAGSLFRGATNPVLATTESDGREGAHQKEGSTSSLKASAASVHSRESTSSPTKGILVNGHSKDTSTVSEVQFGRFSNNTSFNLLTGVARFTHP